MTLSGLFLGALLALIGQTYQTGADTWQLFGWWALLLLPWALVSGNQIAWLLWIAVINGALGLWLWEIASNRFSYGFFTDPVYLAMAGMNLAFLCVWEAAANHVRVNLRVGPRLLAALVLSIVVWLFCISSFHGFSGLYFGLAWFAVTVGMLVYYRRGRRDLPILAMVLLGGLCVVLRFVGEWLVNIFGEVFALLLLALLLLGLAVWVAHWLRKAGAPTVSTPVGADDAQSAEDAKLAPAQHTSDAFQPWYIQGLLIFGVWVATLLLLGFLFIADLVRTPATSLGLGLTLAAVGVYVIRYNRGLFVRQCAAAVASVSMVLCAMGLFGLTSLFGATVLLLGIATLIYIFAADVVLRFLSGGAISLALAILIQLSMRSSYDVGDAIFGAFIGHHAPGSSLAEVPGAVFGAWFSAALFYLGHRFKHHPCGRALQPLAWAAVLSLSGQIWHIGGISLTQLPAAWALAPFLTLALLVGALLPAVAMALLLWPSRAQLTPALVWGAPIALVILAFFWLPSLGVAFALTGVLLGFAVKQPVLKAFGVASLLIYLLVYYYQLDVPLLEKSLWLCIAAALLFVMFLAVSLIPHLTRTAVKAPAIALPPVSALLRGRIVVILAGLALVLGAANYSIWKYERLLAQGRSVILELTPVDPRSLMQGDYMDLSFSVSEDAAALRYSPENPAIESDLTDGYLVLSPDSRGVFRLQRIQAERQPHGDNEQVLRFRVRENGVRVVTNAYFFPEGRAGQYEKARYGEVKVNENGDGLLLRLLDEQLQPF